MLAATYFSPNLVQDITFNFISVVQYTVLNDNRSDPIINGCLIRCLAAILSPFETSIWMPDTCCTFLSKEGTSTTCSDRPRSTTISPVVIDAGVSTSFTIVCLCPLIEQDLPFGFQSRFWNRSSPALLQLSDEHPCLFPWERHSLIMWTF